jgi:signal recognition particle subunit SRP72
MKACTSREVQQKLNTAQEKAIIVNNTLLNLYSNQLEACKTGTSELESKYNASETGILLRVSLALREKKVEIAVGLLQNFMTENKYSSAVPFALAQLYLNEGKLDKAFSVLKPYTTEPAILGLVVSMLVATGRASEAIGMLEEALKHGKQSSSERLHKFKRTIREELAKLAIEQDDFSAATRHLEELRKLAPKDPGVLARLIKAYSKYDAAKAEELTQASGDLLQLDTDLDVDELENSSWLSLGAKYTAKRSNKAKEFADDGIAKKKQKKKRKPRLPKNFDPNVPPDPERWLPRYERSQFKRKKDKRAREKDVSRGTQGTAIAGDAKVESSPAPATAAVPASPLPAAPGPRQQRPGQTKAKKKPKGKGGKW